MEIQQFLFNCYMVIGGIAAIGLLPYLLKDDESLKRYKAEMKMKYSYGIDVDNNEGQ